MIWSHDAISALVHSTLGSPDRPANGVQPTAEGLARFHDAWKESLSATIPPLMQQGPTRTRENAELDNLLETLVKRSAYLVALLMAADPARALFNSPQSGAPDPTVGADVDLDDADKPGTDLGCSLARWGTGLTRFPELVGDAEPDLATAAALLATQRRIDYSGSPPSTDATSFQESDMKPRAKEVPVFFLLRRLGTRAAAAAIIQTLGPRKAGVAAIVGKVRIDESPMPCPNPAMVRLTNPAELTASGSRSFPPETRLRQGAMLGKTVFMPRGLAVIVIRASETYSQKHPSPREIGKCWIAFQRTLAAWTPRILPPTVICRWWFIVPWRAASELGNREFCLGRGFTLSSVAPTPGATVEEAKPAPQPEGPDASAPPTGGRRKSRQTRSQAPKPEKRKTKPRNKKPKKT